MFNEYIINELGNRRHLVSTGCDVKFYPLLSHFIKGKHQYNFETFIHSATLEGSHARPAL